MIFALVAFIVFTAFTFVLLAITAYMAYETFINDDSACFGPTFGYGFFAGIMALITAIPAQHIWGGGF